MHKVRPDVHSWGAYPQQSQEPLQMELYFTVFTAIYRSMLRFEYVRNKLETETLHCGAVFLKIFWNYRSAKCSICGVKFGHDQGQNESGNMLTFEVCCPVVACQWKSCTFKTIFFSNFRPISKLYWWKIVHSKTCSIYMSRFLPRNLAYLRTKIKILHFLFLLPFLDGL